jgi:PHP family Zn ribbon phosphoesterase
MAIHRSIVNEEVGKMVEMMSWKPVAVFRVLDREGQPIGEVVQPKAPPVVGRGAGTVLLVRGGGGEYGWLNQQ